MNATDFVFPQPMTNSANEYLVATADRHGLSYAGLTVRDHVAIEAMKALIDPRVDYFDRGISALAYQYADSMIAESQKEPGS